MQVGRAARRAAAFGGAASVYWGGIFPTARRELRHWRSRAEAIPDPVLRRDALFTHATKSRHAEGLAAFAVLAPPARRQEVVRATVAFEAMLDYLDTVSERPGVDPLANGLQLHRAFEVAVDVNTEPADYYALHSSRNDGGYLAELVATCRATVESLPAYPAALEALRWSARTSGQAQSLTHSIPYSSDTEAIIEWASRKAAELGLDGEVRWWEIVAAGSSSLPIGALIAAAADPATSTADVAGIEAVYFPWTAALSSLLDSLIDLKDDALVANHLNRYASQEEMARRLARLASRSLELAAEVPRSEFHRMIVAATGGYYLAQANAWLDGRARVARAVLEALGAFARPSLTVHCIRQGRLKAGLRAATGRGSGA